MRIHPCIDLSTNKKKKKKKKKREIRFKQVFESNRIECCFFFCFASIAKRKLERLWRKTTLLFENPQENARWSSLSTEHDLEGDNQVYCGKNDLEFYCLFLMSFVGGAFFVAR